MKTAFFLISLLCNSIVWSQIDEYRDIRTAVRLTSSELDESIKTDASRYVFTFLNLMSDIASPQTLDYSMDGKAGTYTLNAQNQMELITAPGAHEFQFFLSERYFEVYTGKLEIESGYSAHYTIRFEDAPMPVISEKPVIYLYPEEVTDVTVQLDIKGKNEFLYPHYDDQWSFTATPDGRLQFGTDEYRYLFWEAEHQQIVPKQEQGFNVAGEDAIQFLEEKLTAAGLNSAEQADFITYWGPRLMENQHNFVRFEFNATCDQYATLNISPKPDQIYRIYMIWNPVDQPLDVLPQTMETVQRDGFTVIEWGGQELNPNLNTNDLTIKE